MQNNQMVVFCHHQYSFSYNRLPAHTPSLLLAAYAPEITWHSDTGVINAIFLPRHRIALLPMMIVLIMTAM